MASMIFGFEIVRSFVAKKNTKPHEISENFENLDEFVDYFQFECYVSHNVSRSITNIVNYWYRFESLLEKKQIDYYKPWRNW